jgi:hypothetical protein
MELLCELSRTRRRFLSEEEIGGRRQNEDEDEDEDEDGAHFKERTSLHDLPRDLKEVRRISVQTMEGKRIDMTGLRSNEFT